MVTMENAEEVMQILERFTRLKQKEIPKELDEYLSYVAKTGDTVFKWPSLKYLFREKLLNVIKHFHDTSPRIDEIPPYPNVDPFNYESMKSALLERLELFNAAPFTIQRLCELLIDPRKQYSRIDKFMRALEKNILVVSTVEPGRKRAESENGDSLDSMVNGDLSLDVNVDIDMEADSLFSLDAQHATNENATNINVSVLNVKNNESEETNAVFSSNDNENKDIHCSSSNTINSELTKGGANEVQNQLSPEESVILNTNICSVVNVNVEAVSNEDDTTVPHPKKVKLDLSLTEGKSVVQENKNKSPTNEEGNSANDQITNDKLPNTSTNNLIVTAKKDINLIEEGGILTPTVVVSTTISETLPAESSAVLALSAVNSHILTETNIATSTIAQSASTSSNMVEVSDLQKAGEKELIIPQHDTKCTIENDEYKEKTKVLDEVSIKGKVEFTLGTNESAIDESKESCVANNKSTEETRTLEEHVKSSAFINTEITRQLVASNESGQKLHGETQSEMVINDGAICQMEKNQKEDDTKKVFVNATTEIQNSDTLADVRDGESIKCESVTKSLDKSDDIDSETKTKTEVMSSKEEEEEKKNDLNFHTEKLKTDEQIVLLKKIDENISNIESNMKTNKFVGTVLNSIEEENSVVITKEVTKETICTRVDEKVNQDENLAKVLPRTPTKVEITPTPLLNQSSFENIAVPVPQDVPLDNSAIQVVTINDQMLIMVAEEEDVPIEEDIPPTLEEVVMAEPPLSSVLQGVGGANLVSEVIAGSSQVGAISNLSPTAMATEDELLSTVIVGSKMNEEEPAGMEVDDTSQEAMDQ